MLISLQTEGPAVLVNSEHAGMIVREADKTGIYYFRPIGYDGVSETTGFSLIMADSDSSNPKSVRFEFNAAGHMTGTVIVTGAKRETWQWDGRDKIGCLLHMISRMREID